MATLTGNTISSSYNGLLKTDDNAVVGASEKNITDGLGNATVLSIGTASASFSGYLRVNSDALHLVGATNPTILVQDSTSGVEVGLKALEASTKIDSTHTFNIEIGNDIIQSVTSSGVDITGTLSSTEDATINGLTIGKGTNDVSTNTALGFQTLENATGVANTAVGYAALLDDTTGVQNTALGVSALRYNTTGSYNTAIGSSSLYENIDGSFNVAIGQNSLSSNTSGNDNVAVGYSSLSANTSGSQNVAIGRQALLANTTGGSNTAIGYTSLVGNITGINNTAVGRSSLYANKGNNNTALGAYALTDNTTGTSNVAIGKEALANNLTGNTNTAIGNNSLNFNTTANNNTAIGNAAMYTNTTGALNVAVGNLTLYYNTTGSFNSALGYSALNANTEGQYNTALGYNTLYNNTTGDRNVAIGYSSLLASTTASGNTSVGYQSLYSNTTGANNSAFGDESLVSNLTGGFNVAFGKSASNANSTGTYNSAFGTNALLSNTNGSYNVALGYAAGDGKTAGSNNIYIGALADGATTTTSNEVVIGTSAIGNGSNTITYGNSAVASHHFTSGRVDVSGNLSVDTNALYVDTVNNRVGFGTDAPLSSFHIKNSGSIVARLESTTNSSTAIEFGDSADPDVGKLIYSHVDDSMQFVVNATERMRLTSAGNLGVKTSVPAYPLDVSGLINCTSGYRKSGYSVISQNGTTLRFGNDSYWQSIEMYVLGSTDRNIKLISNGNVGMGTLNPDNISSSGRTLSISTPGALVTDSIAGSLTFITNDTSYTGTYADGVTAEISSISESATGDAFGLALSTGTVTGSNRAERMRITSGGDVLFGASSFVADSLRIDPNGIISTSRTGTSTQVHHYFYNGNGLVGSISTSASATAYNTSSDYRLKENVVEMVGALDRVDALKPSRFNFIAEPNTTVDGFIAHELAEVIPEAVTGDKDALDEEGNPIYQGIDQSKVVPLLVGAIKELSAKVAALESQLNA